MGKFVRGSGRIMSGRVMGGAEELGDNRAAEAQPSLAHTIKPQRHGERGAATGGLNELKALNKLNEEARFCGRTRNLRRRGKS